MITIQTFVPILDLGGTFVFAISGAVAAVNRRLDIFGILVLSFVTGNFGGITRDLLIGAVPTGCPEGRSISAGLCPGGVHHLLLVRWCRQAAQPRAPVRRGRTVVLCSCRRAKGDRVWVEPSNVSTSGHVDRHRRWHDARRAPRGGPPGAAFRSLRRCSAGRRVHRCDRGCARSFLWHLSAGRSDLMLRPSLHGDQARLAFACRTFVRARTRGNRPVER